MKIQLDVPEDMNLKLKEYKIKHKLIRIADVVNLILAEKFGLQFEAQKIKPRKTKQKTEDKPKKRFGIF